MIMPFVAFAVVAHAISIKFDAGKGFGENALGTEFHRDTIINYEL